MAETQSPAGTSSQFGVERPTTLIAQQKANEDVTPNAGTSLQDREAEGRGETGQVISEWQKKNGIDRSKQIKIVKISHMRYQHPELSKITKFLKDFGMHIVKQTEDKLWWGGYGPDPYVYYCQKGSEKKFLGGTFVVESYQELEKATKLPDASEIKEMKDAPGGGYIVTVHDPNGFPVNLIFGQETRSRGDYPNKLTKTTRSKSLE